MWPTREIWSVPGERESIPSIRRSWPRTMLCRVCATMNQSVSTGYPEPISLPLSWLGIGFVRAVCVTRRTEPCVEEGRSALSEVQGPQDGKFGRTPGGGE